MYCPNCENDNPESAKFCTNCGAKIFTDVSNKKKNYNIGLTSEHSTNIEDKETKSNTYPDQINTEKAPEIVLKNGKVGCPRKSVLLKAKIIVPVVAVFIFLLLISFSLIYYYSSDCKVCDDNGEVVCPACIGNEQAEVRYCSYCGGTGMFRVNEICDGCNGKGILYKKCDYCKGKKKVLCPVCHGKKYGNCKEDAYEYAEKLVEDGSYYQAIEIFEKLGGYKSSEEIIKEAEKKSDSVVEKAAQDALDCAKSEFALGHLKLSGIDTEGIITVYVDKNHHIIAKLGNHIKYDSDNDGMLDGSSDFTNYCGFDTKEVVSSDRYYIVIRNSSDYGPPEFSIEKYPSNLTVNDVVPVGKMKSPKI